MGVLVQRFGSNHGLSVDKTSLLLRSLRDLTSQGVKTGLISLTNTYVHANHMYPQSSSSTSLSPQVTPEPLRESHDRFQINLTGWLFKASSGFRKRFTRRFFALWNSRMLYYFHTDSEHVAFFKGDAGASARAQVDLSTVASVRLHSTTKNLPGCGKGIELHTPSRVWLLVPQEKSEFKPWLVALRHIVNSNLRRIYDKTKDSLLLQDSARVLMLGRCPIQLGTQTFYPML